MPAKGINFPVINTVRWWTLRKSFKRTIPDTVTTGYLSSVLNVTLESAQNIISPLKKIGLIDNDGKPTELAKEWRDDEQYASVCEKIRQAIYPSELLAAFPDADASREKVERWFANKTALGTSQVRSMASFYLLLSEADPTKQDSPTPPTKSTQPTKTASLRTKPPTVKIKTQAEKEASNGTVATAVLEPEVKPNAARVNGYGFGPSLHIDIQIHIAPDATAEQIDQIFASLSKHLYKGNDVHE